MKQITKTTQKTIMVPVECWTCNNNEHRHRTKAVAQQCIDKAAVTTTMLTRDERTRRNIKAAILWVKGTSIRDVASQVGIGKVTCWQRVQRIIAITRHDLPYMPGEPDTTAERHYPQPKDVIAPELRDNYITRIKAIEAAWLKK